MLDEEDVDEDGGVDEEGEGDDEEEGPLYPHLRSRLHERRPLKTNLGRKVSQAFNNSKRIGENPNTPSNTQRNEIKPFDKRMPEG